jgi:DNA-binding MarR family transcriptional regulator
MSSKTARLAAVDREPAAGGGATVAGEPQPLQPPEQLARSFKASMAAVRRLRGRESQCPGELSDAQYSLLFCLRTHSDLPTSELAIAADLSPASTTEMLDGLAAAGLVVRERSQRDRRVVLTSLTDRGRDLVEERRARYEPRWRAASACRPGAGCRSPRRERRTGRPGRGALARTARSTEAGSACEM